jgi:hypothetical protein
MTRYFIAQVAEQDSGRPGRDREVTLTPVRLIDATPTSTQAELNAALNGMNTEIGLIMADVGEDRRAWLHRRWPELTLLPPVQHRGPDSPSLKGGWAL